MNPSEEKQGSRVPPAGSASAGPGSPHSAPQHPEPAESYEDGYPHEATVAMPEVLKPAPPPSRELARRPGGSGKKPPPPPPPGGGGGGSDDEEDGMLRMSFLEHLEELRTRIIRALIGVGVAFVVSLIYTDALWSFVCRPAVAALKSLGY